MRPTRGLYFLAFLYASLSETLADSTLSNLQVDETNAFVSTPRFSWNLRSEDTQTSYRIQVSTSRNKSNNIWDSGVITSSSSLVEYAGPSLSPGTRYFWTVDIQVSAGSAVVASSDFTTSYPPLTSNELSRRQVSDLGTLAMAFRTSTWIWTVDGAPPRFLASPAERFFRKTYVPPAGKTAVLAEVIITADNKFTLYVNGASVGNSPADADSWEEAQGYRLALNPGPVVFAVSAINAPTATGAPNAAGLLVAVRITHSDATQVLFGTDKTWRSNLLVVPSFQSPDLDDSTWVAATELVKFGGGPWTLLVTLPTALNAVSLPAPSTLSALPSTSSTLPLPSSTSSLPLTSASSTTLSSSTSSSALITSSSTVTVTRTSADNDATAPAASSTSNSTSNSKSGTNPAVVGGALGGVLAVFALLGIGLLLWRRHRRAQDELVAADFDTWIPASHVGNSPKPPSMSQVPGPSASPRVSPSTLRQPQYLNTSDQYTQSQSQAPYRYPPPSVSMAGGAGADADAYAGQYGGEYGATGSGGGYGVQTGGYAPGTYGQSGGGYSAGQEYGSSVQLVPRQNSGGIGANVPPSLTPGSSQGYHPQTRASLHSHSTSYDRRYY